MFVLVRVAICPSMGLHVCSWFGAFRRGRLLGGLFVGRCREHFRSVRAVTVIVAFHPKDATSIVLVFLMVGLCATFS